MSSLNPHTVILQSLYRSLLKQSRIIDQSPIHQCFLVSKPRKIYVHEYGQAVNVRLYNTDFEIVERILNDHCGGEYFCPSYPNQESKSLQSIIKHIFRFGIPSKYDISKVLDPNKLNNTNAQIQNKYLELSFYAKKRLSHSTNVINKIPTTQQTQFLNAFHTFSQSLSTTPTTTDISDDPSPTESPQQQSFTKMPLTQPFSITSLTPLNTESNSVDDDATENNSIISKGTLLISHPLACLGQPDLYRKVILIIEQSPDRIVGITLNSAHSLFDDNARKPSSKRSKSKRMNVTNSNEFEYCFRGWRGEYNYIGGPVNDQNCPFCILHSNAVFFEKFKESSIRIVDDENETEADHQNGIYWTWVTADNYTAIYHALNRITRIIQFKEKEEISGKTAEQISDAEIVSDAPSETSGEQKEGDDGESGDNIAKDEFFESISVGKDGDFKFFQKYSYWAPSQLEVEIKNNVWFPAKLTDDVEMRQLLKLKCPSAKLVAEKGGGAGGKRERGDYKKQFNKWMWQAMIKGLGNEFQILSVFPDLINEQTKEFYAFMEEFHSSWVPDVEADEAYISDDEEEDTVW